MPGFVDVHVHGGGGASFDEVDHEAARRVVDTHRAHGTTTMLASVATGPLDAMTKAVASLAELVHEGLVAGVHLEGPFLSQARCGAHDPNLLRPPAAADVGRLLSAGRGTVRMVTLAPELDGGLEAVRRVVGAGALAAVGHTDGRLRRHASPPSTRVPLSPPTSTTRCHLCTTAGQDPSQPCCRTHG